MGRARARLPSAQAWALALNYDGRGAGLAGAPVAAASGAPGEVGAHAFLDGALLRVLLTGRTAPSAGGATAGLAVAFPAGTPAGTVTAQAWGFSKGAPALARLPDVELPCGEGAGAGAVALPAWSATLLVLPWGAGACVAR